jgi:repressor LexA
MTNLQQSILTFIRQFIVAKGYPPTCEEIRAGCGLSSRSVVHYHLVRLERAGRITHKPRSPRSIQIQPCQESHAQS